jgi:hypothetical protein
LGTKVIICKPGGPEAKGLVERLHDYLERSLLPGRQSAAQQTSIAPDAGHPMASLSSGEGGDALTRAANFG